MFLEKLEIKGMFGSFSYSLEFDEDMSIITAPNGYGKTICLKMIHAIFNLNFMYFADIEFNQISLTTKKGILSILKKTNPDESYQKNKLRDEKKIFNPEEENETNIFFSDFDIFQSNIDSHQDSTNNIEIILNVDEDLSVHRINLYEQYELYRRRIDEMYPFLSRMGNDKWRDLRSGNRSIYNFEEVVENFGLPDMGGEYLHIPSWLREFSRNQKTYFVEDQRLLLKKTGSSSRNDYFNNAIERYSDRLKTKIRDSSVKVSMNSQKLDSTFPKRLVNSKDKFNELSKNDLIKALEDIQDKRKKLMQYDLLSQDDSFDNEIRIDHIDDNDVKVLNLYVLDTNEKLSSFDGIYEKINTFVEILNRKLMFKKAKVSSDRGFYFVKDDKNNINHSSEKILSLSKLSSGEQHQVVLLYQLMFNTEESTLVLIDEPEISLHVVWQEQFLEDLKIILDMNQANAIIATHSPQIIGENWDLVIDLEEIRESSSKEFLDESD